MIATELRPKSSTVTSIKLYSLRFAFFFLVWNYFLLWDLLIFFVRKQDKLWIEIVPINFLARFKEVSVTIRWTNYCLRVFVEHDQIQTTSFRNWTRVTVSISNDDNHYTTCANIMMNTHAHIYIYIKFKSYIYIYMYTYTYIIKLCL